MNFAIKVCPFRAKPGSRQSGRVAAGSLGLRISGRYRLMETSNSGALTRKGLKIPVWTVRFCPWALRFESKIDRSGGPDACHPWKASTYDGYGRFWVGSRPDRKLEQAHRIAWAIAHIEVTYGMEVRHVKCANRACCNVRHMSLGTHAQNMADMVADGHSTKGEKNPRAKLTEAQVMEIRASRSSYAELAASYGVSRSLIGQIRGGVAWAHLPLTKLYPVEIVDRFDSHVDRSAGLLACHPWTLKLDRDGYGDFWIGGKRMRAARFALELKLGRHLAPGEVARHGNTCASRACCNEDHLSPGTQADNIRDRDADGNAPLGERNGKARVTTGQALDAIRRHGLGETIAGIAREFGVSSACVRHITAGRNWTHVTGVSL